MFKTLYLRIVFTFLTIVLVSIGIASLVTSLVYTNLANAQMKSAMLNTAKQAIVEYQRDSTQDFSNYTRVVRSVGGYDIEVYSGASDLLVAGGMIIPKNVVQKVLSGSSVELFDIPYHGLLSQGPGQDQLLQGQHGISPHKPSAIVGLPFSIGQKKYAVFVLPTLPAPPPKVEITRFLVTVVLIVLLVGSLLILVASRYLVRPIRVITDATRRVAKGDFDVSIWFNRQDEIGILARSFTAMTQELKQMEEMRQEFVSNVSHEIQSPLTSIRGFSKALREGVIPESERDKYLGTIEIETERISRMSENLLKLASLESEHHPVNMKPYRLDEQIRRTILATEPQWSEKKLNIDLDLPKTVVTADSDLLEQVWMNLIVNSIRYTPPEGGLRVRISSSVTDVFVQVQDTGIGIPQMDQNKIFQRFYKVDKARTRSMSGSGLGLSIVHKIISLHNGRIELKSQVGSGTTFTVSLPKAQGL